MTGYTDTLQRGDTISCYQIEEVLGRGGFAVTYLAVDLNLDVHVAIKEYLPREIIQRDDQLNVSPRRPEFVEDYNIGLSNFAREAKTLARFKHLNIVRVHQVIHKFNTAYMVMDYEHGRELASVLDERQTLPEDELREIVFPIFDGVEEIHRHGLAHRDIKPSNIYLRDNGSPVLLDFGAARYTMSESTQQLTAVVTVGYTPIEQYNVSDNDQGPWSDIYALSAVLYEAVTGEMPVDSVTRASSQVTNSSDPLAPVSNKAKHDYSDYFLNAIDWGLNMEAQDRPQSIAQWRDAFDGVFKPTEEYRDSLSRRPLRRSKLKTRGKDPVAAKGRAQNHSDRGRSIAADRSFIPDIDPPLDVDVRDIPFDPNFDNEVGPVEIVPLNPDAAPRRAETAQASAATYSDATATLAPPPPPSPFASNPAPKTRTDLRDDEFSDTLNNLIDAEGRPTHTQELRKVLRRDIVRREPPPAPAQPAEPPYPDPFPRSPTYSAPDHNAEPVISTEVYNERAYRPDSRRMGPPPGRMREDFQFEHDDWDYEPPPSPSRWKWIFPVAGLALIAGASLFFVNNPDLLSRFTQSGPDMTIDTALARANDKIQNGELIFPAGQSALDYYQLILQADPDNAPALQGVATIRNEIRKQIVVHVDNDNLPEANRLLSRANAVNLQIDAADQQNSTTSAVGDDSTFDNDTTPWVEQRIEDIESLLIAGDYPAAKILFNNVDKYIEDAEVHASLKARIEQGGTSTGDVSPSIPDAVTDNAIATPVDTSRIVAETDDPIAGDSPVDTAMAANVAEPADTIESNTQSAVPPSAAPVAPAVSEVEQKIAIRDNDTLPSAPRRSFIEGNDATAQHLNQLRLALEDKSLQRVLEVSQSLPEERIEFLRRLFQRYDRVDVTIDNINRAGNNATAMLSVSMFNQRSDGSYYSAGKWSDVELSASQRNGEWQPIRW